MLSIPLVSYIIIVARIQPPAFATGERMCKLYSLGQLEAKNLRKFIKDLVMACHILPLKKPEEMPLINQPQSQTLSVALTGMAKSPVHAVI